MEPAVRVVGLGGSLRKGSTSLAALQITDDVIAGQLAALGAEVVRAARQMAAQGRCDYSEPWQ